MKSITQRTPKRYAPKQPTTERTCPNCRKVFLRWHSQPSNYCSQACQHEAKRNNPERFWSKVDKTSSPNGCWLWTKGKTHNGYGMFSLDRSHKHIRAHRHSYALANGLIPNGYIVCHNCPGGDNPSCVNPAHLFLGTVTDNVMDRNAKGRQARGDRHGRRVNPEAWSRRTLRGMP